MVWKWQRHRGHRPPGSGAGVVPAEEGAAAAALPAAGRVDPLSDPAFVAGLRPIPTGPTGPTGPGTVPAHDISGVDPSGAPVELRIRDHPPHLLLAFLHIRCDGCDEFWRGLRDDAEPVIPASVSAAVVTRGPGSVPPEEVSLVAAGLTRVPVIMSDAGWSDYRVTGYPFFVLVDTGSGTVAGETVGFGWADVVAMVRAAGA